MKAHRVLYLDLESPQALVSQKLDPIAEGDIPDGLAFICEVSLDRQIGELISLVKQHGFDIVIVDTVSEAFDTKDENDNAEANRQMSALRRLAQDTGCAIVLAHHLGKGESSQQVYRARGASARAAAADVVMNLETTTDDVVCLKVVKSRWAGNEQLFLRKAGDDRFEATEVAREDTVNAKLVAQQEILDLLPHEGEGEMQTKDIVEGLEGKGCSKPTIERALADLVKLAKIQRARKGFYCLPSMSSTIPSINHTPMVDGIDGSDEYITEII